MLTTTTTTRLLQNIGQEVAFYACVFTKCIILPQISVYQKATVNEIE